MFNSVWVCGNPFSYTITEHFIFFGVICTISVIIVWGCNTLLSLNSKEKKLGPVSNFLDNSSFIILLLITALFWCDLVAKTMNFIYDKITPKERPNFVQYSAVSCISLSENLPKITHKLGAGFTKEKFYGEFIKIDGIINSRLSKKQLVKGGKVIEVYDAIDYEFYGMPSMPPYKKQKYKNKYELDFSKDMDNPKNCNIEKKNCYVSLYPGCEFYYDGNKNFIPSDETAKNVARDIESIDYNKKFKLSDYIKMNIYDFFSLVYSW